MAKITALGNDKIFEKSDRLLKETDHCINDPISQNRHPDENRDDGFEISTH